MDATDDEPVYGEVTIYYLTDEELARYRALPMPPGAKEAARRQHRKRKGADEMPKVLSEETHERVDTMIRQGNGPTAIVRATGVSTGTVYYRAAKLGTPRFDYGAQQWVAATKEGENVTDAQARKDEILQTEPTVGADQGFVEEDRAKDLQDASETPSNARPEIPQYAEANDTRTHAAKAVALKDLKDLLAVMGRIASYTPLDTSERDIVTEALTECLARREQVLLS